MRPFRVRLKLLPFGNYAIQVRQFPWSWWREDKTFEDRTMSLEESLKRARYLMSDNFIPHKEIMREK